MSPRKTKMLLYVFVGLPTLVLFGPVAIMYLLWVIENPIPAALSMAAGLIAVAWFALTMNLAAANERSKTHE